MRSGLHAGTRPGFTIFQWMTAATHASKETTTNSRMRRRSSERASTPLFVICTRDMGDGRRDGPATEINRTLGTRPCTDSSHVCSPGRCGFCVTCPSPDPGPHQLMDDDWDDAVLNEQVRQLRQERQGQAGQVSGAPAPALSLVGKRSATALGLGRGRSRRWTSDMRTAAPAEAAAPSVALAAVARGARGRRLAHAGTGHCHGASAQLAPKRRGALDKAAAAQKK